MQRATTSARAKLWHPSANGTNPTKPRYGISKSFPSSNSGTV
jgi:hypothetical protein